MNPAQPQRDRRERTRASYDVVAEEYAARIYGELAGKPFDREWLDDFAQRTRPLGPVCDLGCGPGQIARYLHERGARCFGLDLSFGNLKQARRLNSVLEFVQGDMMVLPFADETLGGIAAFYSIIHLERDQVLLALREMCRVLCPGGWLLLAFHLGTGTLHEDQLWGYAVDFDATMFSLPEVVQHAAQAGLVVKRAVERDPYAPEVEYQSRRGYILARRS
ncbi:MAG TPA: methyltransferase domain-containing protein [Terriglobales bacterium]|nr:methyltransferase domain-containing protein [Terriglobales bacterium]